MKRHLLACLCALASCAAPAQDTPGHQDEAFRSLAARFFTVALPFEPSEATALGIHTYDDHLEDWSGMTLHQEIYGLHYFLGKFEAFPEAGLDESTQGDLEMMRNSLRSQLLTLETLKPWQKNPDMYSSGITSAAFVLMERDFAPANDRLRSLISREKQMPKVLEEARQNLANPPQVYTEIALEQLPGDLSFFEHDVPQAFAAATDPELQQQFTRSNQAVIAALTSYQQWMHDDLLPRSHGEFKWGPETLAKKLAYDEMVTTPLPQLLALAEADLRRNQAESARVAHRIDPTKTPEQVREDLDADHGAANQLLQTFRDRFASEIAFIHAKNIITIPSTLEPVVEETPPFMRATTQASMDPPGPFEANSKTAYFNVTLPDPSWTAQETNAYLSAFNVGTVVSTSVHEAYPGHYVQFLWVNTAGLSQVRKIVTATTNVEGWAHYCEQMMLDEGYGQPGAGATTEREANLIRLGQLQDALLRDARFVVALQMLGGDMTMAQARQFFIEQGYQTAPIAEMEVKRGTSDDYLYYTLGKLMILKLRADLQAKQGPAFSLEKFHDAFMRQGGAPLPIVRQALLGNDSPAL